MQTSEEVRPRIQPVTPSMLSFSMIRSGIDSRKIPCIFTAGNGFQSTSTLADRCDLSTHRWLDVGCGRGELLEIAGGHLPRRRSGVTRPPACFPLIVL